VAAVQTGASASQKISSDLANIDAVRAAAHADPTSPTGAAVRDGHETLGLTQKSINVDNTSNQEASDAAYMRSAAKTALLAGEISAGAGLLDGIGQGAIGPRRRRGGIHAKGIRPEFAQRAVLTAMPA
jgi:hypothetical protein